VTVLSYYTLQTFVEPALEAHSSLKMIFVPRSFLNIAPILFVAAGFMGAAGYLYK